MDAKRLRELLEEVAAGSVAPEDAATRLRGLPFEDLGFAKLDHHRQLRMGYPETIFCAGKTPEQIVKIAQSMREHGNVLGTRCADEALAAVRDAIPDAVIHEMARTFTITVNPPEMMDGYVAVVCAGTSDMPVAEEAVVTCEACGSRVERVYDVGVAGIQRLFAKRAEIEAANAIIVCAGMEGALPSVVGGLADAPVIACPTSIGYGASFNGVAALLGMLNSCATGLTVVNIDNGFGAAIAASTINRIANGKLR